MYIKVDYSKSCNIQTDIFKLKNTNKNFKDTEQSIKNKLGLDKNKDITIRIYEIEEI